jgi:hypothetical protein
MIGEVGPAKRCEATRGAAKSSFVHGTEDAAREVVARLAARRAP